MDIPLQKESFFAAFLTYHYTKIIFRTVTIDDNTIDGYNGVIGKIDKFNNA